MSNLFIESHIELWNYLKSCICGEIGISDAEKIVTYSIIMKENVDLIAYQNLQKTDDRQFQRSKNLNESMSQGDQNLQKNR